MSENNLKFWTNDFIKNKGLFSMIISGSRRSGKSYLVRDLFKKQKLNDVYDFIIIFSNNDDNLDFYSEFVVSDMFFKEFDNEIISRVKEMSEEYKNNGVDKKFLIVLDDSISNQQKHDEEIMQLYTQGRHYNLSVIWCTQKMSMISTSCRNNSDFVFIGQCKSASEKKAITDNFLMGLIDDDNQKSEIKFYRALIKKYTVDYSFLVLDFTNTKSGDFNDTVFYYKA